MTSDQIDLARHALGLPNIRNKSYRNRFYAGERNPDYATWCDMVAAGWARGKSDGNLTFFWLLENGAKLALVGSETLDPEDFPSPQERETP